MNNHLFWYLIGVGFSFICCIIATIWELKVKKLDQEFDLNTIFIILFVLAISWLSIIFFGTMIKWPKIDWNKPLFTIKAKK